MSGFFVARETSKSPIQAFVDLRKAADAAKWGILGVHDFGEILASKGLPQTESYKSLQVCAPAHAHEMLKLDPLVGLCMPCNLLVFTENGTTRIAALAVSSVIPHLFQGQPAMTERAGVIEAELRAIVEAAV